MKRTTIWDLFISGIKDDEDFENIEGAMIAFREVVRADTSHIDARIRLGMLNLKSGFYESALRELEEVLNIAPESAQAHAGLGEAFYTIALGKEVKIEHPTGLGATRDIKGSKDYFKRVLEEFNKAISLDKKMSERLSKTVSRAERNIK